MGTKKETKTKKSIKVQKEAKPYTFSNRERPENAVLNFSPSAMMKLKYFQSNANGVEVSGFGISSRDNPLDIVDFQIVKQESEIAFTSMDDDDISDMTLDYVDQGILPWQTTRIWIHTHPISPKPSYHDEMTFQKSFGKCEWAIMCIIGDDGDLYARLHMNTPFEMNIELPCKVDWTLKSEPVDYDELSKIYVEKVRPYKYVYSTRNKELGYGLAVDVYDDWDMKDYEGFNELSEFDLAEAELEANEFCGECGYPIDPETSQCVNCYSLDIIEIEAHNQWADLKK